MTTNPDHIILNLCRMISRPSAFHEVLEAETIVESEDVKTEIHSIAVRLYHYDEGRNI